MIISLDQKICLLAIFGFLLSIQSGTCDETTIYEMNDESTREWSAENATTTSNVEISMTDQSIANSDDDQYLIELATAIRNSPGQTFNETSSYNQSFQTTLNVLFITVVIFIVMAVYMMSKCWRNYQRQKSYKRASTKSPDDDDKDDDDTHELRTFRKR